MKLSPTEIYQGRKIFLIGSTGFLGKVTLSMLLHRFPNVGKVYVTVRARSLEESRTRFWNNVITAPPFDPLRERYGSAFEGFIKDKVEILGGDIGDDNLGYTEEEAQALASDIDIVLNSAGNVTFNPTLESALRTNVVGTQNVVAFAKRMRRPALIHVSTCFVAGNRSGPVWESDPVVGYFPRKEELPGVEFSVEQEIRDCARLAERVRDEARDAMQAARFREQARKRLVEEGRDPDDLDATGDSNPNDMRRIVGLLGLYKRKHFEEKESGFRVVNEIAGRMETKPVSPSYFEKTSTPMINAAAKKASSLLDSVRPRWGGGRLTEWVDHAKQTVDRVEEVTRETAAAFELFRPFMIENAYVFRADNVRSLHARIRKDEQPLLPWWPERLDWYDYWMNVHFPGLKKWIFPTLEEDMRAQPKRVYTYRDLLELFETSAKRFSTRVAMRIERDGQKEQYTYADLHELATRAAAFFAASGVKPADRVLLVSHNAPEWGISYFGVLKAGATCVPVDPESKTDELVNFTRASGATGLILGEKADEEHPDLQGKLIEAGLDA